MLSCSKFPMRGNYLPEDRLVFSFPHGVAADFCLSKSTIAFSVSVLVVRGSWFVVRGSWFVVEGDGKGKILPMNKYSSFPFRVPETTNPRSQHSPDVRGSRHCRECLGSFRKKGLVNWVGESGLLRGNKV